MAAGREGVGGLEEAIGAQRALAVSRRPHLEVPPSGMGWATWVAESRGPRDGLHRHPSLRVAASDSPPSPSSGCERVHWRKNFFEVEHRDAGRTSGRETVSR